MSSLLDNFEGKEKLDHLDESNSFDRLMMAFYSQALKDYEVDVFVTRRRTRGKEKSFLYGVWSSTVVCFFGVIAWPESGENPPDFLILMHNICALIYLYFFATPVKKSESLKIPFQRRIAKVTYESALSRFERIGRRFNHPPLLAYPSESEFLQWLEAVVDDVRDKRTVFERFLISP